MATWQMHPPHHACYGAAVVQPGGPFTPLLYGRRSTEVLRKKLTVLVAMAVMLAVMVASAGMASASPINGASHVPRVAEFGIGVALFNFGSFHGPPS